MQLPPVSPSTSGSIGICPGGYMTASTLVELSFLGKKAHAASPEKGVDAIAMAVEAGDRMHIFGINCFLGSTAALHCDDFRIDERGMETAVEAFAAFVLGE